MRALLFCMLLLPSVLRAQSKADTTVYTVVEQQPEYPGGDRELSKDISKQVHVPNNTKESLSSLTFAVITFVVEKDGKISHAKTTRGSNTIGQQMITAVSAKTWKPGIVGGKAVRTKYSIPMHLSLAAEE